MTKKTLSGVIREIGASDFAREIGCHRSAANCWALGKRKPSPEMVRRIRKRFGLTVEQIRPDLY